MTKERKLLPVNAFLVNKCDIHFNVCGRDFFTDITERKCRLAETTKLSFQATDIYRQTCATCEDSCSRKW